jgi:hypothetical protein
MKSLILTGALTIAFSFITSSIISHFNFGSAVDARFIERSRTIPETNEAISAESLTRWVKKNPAQAKSYAFPVLFPLDFLFLIFLGLFTAIASQMLIASIDWPPAFRILPAWAGLIAPFVYIISDGLEDLIAIALLSVPNLINSLSVELLTISTTIKLISCTLALAQTIVLAVAGFLLR